MTELKLTGAEQGMLDGSEDDKRPQVDGRLSQGGRPGHLDMRALSTAAAAELGQDIAWAESNAILFANSVLCARTDRLEDCVETACTGGMARNDRQWLGA